MNRSHVLPGSLVIAVLIALAMGIFFWGFNGSTASSLTATQEISTGSGGTSESVLVRGHWEINILEPDGTLVSSQVFDNALDDIGKVKLAKFLSRERLPGLWRVGLIHTGAAGPVCLNAIPAPAGCVFAEADDPAILEFQPQIQKVLVVSRPVSPGDTVVLAGQGVAQRAGEISTVITLIEDCNPANATECSATLFTETSISPETVSEGQIIQVEVTLSFGTLPTPQ